MLYKKSHICLYCSYATSSASSMWLHVMTEHYGLDVSVTMPFLKLMFTEMKEIELEGVKCYLN